MRIDLAGGTLDLYPIYLFEEGGLTINCAVNMYSTVVLESRSDEAIWVSSNDLGIEEKYENVDSLNLHGVLGLISRAIKFFKPDTGMNVNTENNVTKGTGLGASSALLVAALAALNELSSRRLAAEQLIDIAADLEAQCIRVPTGKQDYYSAFFGGINALWFDVGGNRRECLASDEQTMRELEDRLILSFTGTPRFSGATNWNMIKNYIENCSETVGGIKRIKEIAGSMRDCITLRNWDRLAFILQEEWRERRVLAEGVTNEKIEKIMDAALGGGALANKLCGAGGGGCMITCVDPANREEVEAALSAAGAEVLPFRIARNGVGIETLGELETAR